MATRKGRSRMFGTGHDGPWQVHCKILSQYQTGTCPQTAAAAPQSSPASLAAPGSSYGPSHQGSPPSPAYCRRCLLLPGTPPRRRGTACWHRRGLHKNNNGMGARGLHAISLPTSLLDRFGGLVSLLLQHVTSDVRWVVNTEYLNMGSGSGA